MKIIITIVATLLIAVPLMSFALGGVVAYQRIEIPWFGINSSAVLTKIYDHDEKIVCYTLVSGGSRGAVGYVDMSCFEDKSN